MAYYIEPAPVLDGKDAERFLNLMSTADTRTEDFSKERKIVKEIIDKSDLSFLK